MSFLQRLTTFHSHLFIGQFYYESVFVDKKVLKVYLYIDISILLKYVAHNFQQKLFDRRRIAHAEIY